MRLTRYFYSSVLVLIAVFAFVATFEAQRNVRPQSSSRIVAANNIPAPEDILGFKPGDDRKLASWSQVIEYFQKLDAASDRVTFKELGKSTMGAPFVMATISAPENLARLDEFRKIQEQLADPRKLGSTPAQKAEQLIARGKTIVLITCGIHSDEVGSYLSSMLIAHRLASSNDPAVLKILRETIVLLVPSLNPDGVDIIKNWYDKTLGTPYEGTEPPELYNKYTGHDDNRDWYALTQVETRITVNEIHNVWHPLIVHDIHQQGPNGARLFLPPYMDPVEPNVPKQIVEGYTELGKAIASEMRAKGFKGITTGTTYDAWSPSRAYSHYHGGVRILSETASCKIATPITIKFDDLRGAVGYDAKKETEKFFPIWRGGEWHLRDITNYMTTAAFILLNHAAENREQWLRRFYEIGHEAVRPRKRGELWGFKINSASSWTSYYLEEILKRTGIEVIYTKVKPVLKGKQFSRILRAEEAIVRMDQPYGAFAKALLETQQYPNLRDSSGNPVAPYDVTSHTLPLLMGVDVQPLYQPVKYTAKSIERNEFIWGKRPGVGFNVAIYKSYVPSMDEGWTRWTMLHDANFLLDSVSSRDEVSDGNLWTLQDKETREGNLRSKYNAIIIPDQSASAIFSGHKVGMMPEEYTGGLGPEGVKSLREFVEQGGTLVCLNRASKFAIEHFKLPIRDLTDGLKRTEFYVPGSILRIELDRTHPITEDQQQAMKIGFDEEWSELLYEKVPKESIAWVENSPVFEVVEGQDAGRMPALPGGTPALPGMSVRVIARYPANKDPLLSGWLLGGDRMRGKAALVEVTMGKGRVVLFGFRPQYRGQSLATYLLLFNALRPPGKWD